MRKNLETLKVCLLSQKASKNNLIIKQIKKIELNLFNHIYQTSCYIHALRTQLITMEQYHELCEVLGVFIYFK